MSQRLVLGVCPTKQTAQHNMASWNVVAAIMAAYGNASKSDLVAAVSQHQHEGGGVGFIEYCIRLGWLKIESTT